MKNKINVCGKDKLFRLPKCIITLCIGIGVTVIVGQLIASEILNKDVISRDWLYGTFSICTVQLIIIIISKIRRLIEK